MAEQVLVFPEEVLLEHLGPWVAAGAGILTGFDALAALNEIIQPKNLSYIERGPAETNPKFKQLIPYIVLRRGDEVFKYQRSSKGGEGRLQGKWSIGAGGHVNPIDGVVTSAESYMNAFWRELKEEVNIDPHSARVETLGILHDPSNAVGQVHFGIIHFLNVTGMEKVETVDPALANGQFDKIDNLKAASGDFETWSQFIINHLL
jgi:predicted NUDIX family phosphoesterase